MRIVLTRASVCMGDDVLAPHERVCEVADGTPLADVLALAEGYCPPMRGAGWTAHLGWNQAEGEPLALLDSYVSSLRLLPGAEAAVRPGVAAGVLEIFWDYHSRMDVSEATRR